MALKRTDIKGIFPDATAEQIQILIDKHSETVESLLAQLEESKTLCADATKNEQLYNDVTAKHAIEIEKKEKEFADYKQSIENKTVKEKKQALYTAELKTAGVSDIAISKAVKLFDYDAMELNGDVIKSPKTIQESIVKEWGDFIPVRRVIGANPPTPPQNETITTLNRSDIAKMSVEQINTDWARVSEALKNNKN